MADSQLIEQIKALMLKRYSPEQIFNYLSGLGYDPKQLKAAITYVHDYDPPKVALAQEAKPKSSGLQQILDNMKNLKVSNLLGERPVLMISAIGFVILILIVAGIYMWMLRPVCGNGVIEEGEDIDTCCLDAGCIGEQSCEENICVEPTCGYCQFVEDHKCKDYGCCADSECIGEQTCQYKKCVDPECGSCQYLEDHRCKDYSCCQDSDCEDMDGFTEDLCESPSTLDARCSYVRKVDISGNKASISLSIDRKIRFSFNDIEHTISVENIDALSITILVASTPKKITLAVGNTAYVDLDEDGLDDISIKIVSLISGEAQAELIELKYACLTDADCDDNNALTNDTCINPRTVQSYCENLALHECDIDTDCNDNNNATRDFCFGMPRICYNNNITTCIDWDNYCPGICTYVNDSDCHNPMYDYLYNYSGGLTIDIITDKDQYSVMEQFHPDNRYDLAYSGESFEAILLYKYSKQGLDVVHYSSMHGTILSGSFDTNLGIFRMAFSGFVINASGFSIKGDNYFSEEGVYNLGFYVFHCGKIDEILGTVDCGKVGESYDYERIDSDIIPLKSVLKSITVVTN